MELVDTHVHLTFDPLSQNLEAVLERARVAGVTRVVVPAYDHASWSRMDHLAGRHGISVAYGLHPWVANDGIDGRQLAARLQASSAVAVGEIGLDFAIESFDREAQLRVLRSQLEVAAELELPVLLHCRKAFDELLALLQPFAPRLRGVLHAFSRGPELARRFLDLGLSLGFGGAITRPRAVRARRAAAMTPWDRIVLETDAPSLGLEGVEPARVEPCHTADVARAMAELRGESLVVVATRTTENARSLFRLS